MRLGCHRSRLRDHLRLLELRGFLILFGLDPREIVVRAWEPRIGEHHKVRSALVPIPEAIAVALRIGKQEETVRIEKSGVRHMGEMGAVGEKQKTSG